MLKKYQTAGNIKTNQMLTLLLVCALFFYIPALQACPKGATIISVPTESRGLPDTAEEMETLLHHEKGIIEPLLHKGEADDWPDMEKLTPENLKALYGAIPVNIRNNQLDENLVPMHMPEALTLSTIIEMIESSEYNQGLVFDGIVDKQSDAIFKYVIKQARSIEKKGELTTPEILDILKGLDKYKAPLPALLFPTELEDYFRFPRSHEKRRMAVRIPYQAFQFFLKLPPQLMALHIANKHFVFGPAQLLNDTSRVIIQTHGQQKIILMSPDSMRTSPTLFNAQGQFDCPEVDLSAPEHHLRNEERLANTKLYSTILFAGDVLLIPANWFVYQQSLSTSVSATFTYLSGDVLPVLPQAQFIKDKLLSMEAVVEQWEEEEKDRHPENKQNIMWAAEIIKTSLHDAACRRPGLRPVLNLQNLELASLPAIITQMEHIRHLNLKGNRLTIFSLFNMKNLESLDLSHNQLTKLSINNMENLTSLNVSRNQLTKIFMSDAKNLELLDLSHNLLPEFCLHSAKKLKKLTLCHNEIKSFQSNNLPCISFIDLGHNQIVSLEGRCLSGMNTDNHLWLALENNPLSKDGLLQIQSGILFRKGKARITFPSGTRPLTKEQIEEKKILISRTRKKSMPFSLFTTLLEEKGISPLPEEFQCPVTHTNPDQVVILKQGNVYKVYDANALLDCLRAKFLHDATAPFTNPMTRVPLKPQDIFSPSEYLLLKKVHK